MTSTERILEVLKKGRTDRPPVICTGGMMNAAIVDVMKTTGHTLPEAHHDSRLMAELAKDVHEQTGFENFGIPFCMTVEAEALGSAINFGSLECEPKIEQERYGTLRDVKFQPIEKLIQGGRIPVALDAIKILSVSCPDVPVIGNLTGPVSTAASIVDPMTFFKELRKDPEQAHAVLRYVTDFLIAFAVRMLESGASLISIGDPSATGEILGPKIFREFALASLNRLLDGIHRHASPAIVHICGDLGSVKPLIPEITSDAISTDAMISLKQLKEEYPGLITMGNLSTYLLQFGDPDKITKTTRRLVQDGINIIAPACGLSTSTSVGNIRAMTNAVKES